MKDINEVILTGRVGNLEMVGEEDSRFLVISLGSHYSVQKGEKWEEKTQWIYCKVFSKEWAKSLNEHLEKGIGVTIHGKIIVTSYVGDDGNKKYGFYIKVSDLVMHGKKDAQGDYEADIDGNPVD